MILRDLDKERKAIGQFQGETGRDPTSHEDWLKIQQEVYGADLPQDLKDINAKYANSQTAGKLDASGVSPVTDLYAQAEKLKTELTGAGKRIQELNAPNDASNLLQEALRIKQGTGDMSIGESEIFKKAGVGGYGALMASLSARRTEINTNFANFQNIVTTMTGHYKDMASVALKNYEIIKDQYDDVMEKVNKLEDDETEYNTYIKKLKAKAEIDRETFNFEQTHKVFAPTRTSDDKETNEFYDAIDAGLEELRKGANWGEVWNILKAKWQPKSDEPIDDVLDRLLNKEFWSMEGAYRKYKESGQTGEGEKLITVPAG